VISQLGHWNCFFGTNTLKLIRRISRSKDFAAFSSRVSPRTSVLVHMKVECVQALPQCLCVQSFFTPHEFSPVHQGSLMTESLCTFIEFVCRVCSYKWGMNNYWKTVYIHVSSLRGNHWRLLHTEECHGVSLLYEISGILAACFNTSSHSLSLPGFSSLWIITYKTKIVQWVNLAHSHDIPLKWEISGLSLSS
jgi:hypothetical protein